MLLRLTVRVLQKKQTAAGYMSQAGKVGSEEKWAQAAMEYIYEKNHVNDGNRKRRGDVDRERRLSLAYDKLLSKQEAEFEGRMTALLARQTQVFETLRDQMVVRESTNVRVTDGAAHGNREEGAGEGEGEGEGAHADDENYLLQEALLLNSAQPPGNYRRPTLTPPLAGYESGFGLDVPQLRTQQPEYPRVVNTTDAVEFTEEQQSVLLMYEERAKQRAASHEQKQRHGQEDQAADAEEEEEEVLPPLFPYCNPLDIRDLAKSGIRQLHEHLNVIRSTAPVTGVEGEAHSAYVHLQLKALYRQLLLLDVADDSKFIAEPDVAYYKSAGLTHILSDEDLGKSFAKLYNAKEEFRRAEWVRRGLLPLAVEESLSSEMQARAGGSDQYFYDEDAYHYAQVPAYHAFREI